MVSSIIEKILSKVVLIVSSFSFTQSSRSVAAMSNASAIITIASPIRSVILSSSPPKDVCKFSAEESKEVEIDCGSKYIHLASLALLILLL